MSVGTIIPETRVLVRQASWDTYVGLRDADENRHLRMTDETTLIREFRKGVHKPDVSRGQ